MENLLHKSFILCNDRKFFYTLHLNKYYKWKKILTVGYPCDIVNIYNSIASMISKQKKAVWCQQSRPKTHQTEALWLKYNT